MPQPETPGVEHRTVEAWFPAPVICVARHGVAERGEMDADLVGAPGVQVTAHERMGSLALDDLVAGPREPAAGDDGHALALFGMAPDGSLELTRVLLDTAGDYGQVGAAQRTILQLGRQRPVARVVAGDDDEPRCALVESVHHARSRRAADLGPRAASAEQGVHERPRVVARGRVDDHACRFVDDGDVLVFVDDVEGDRLRGRIDDVSLRDLELDHVAPRNPVRRVGGMPVDEGEMALDQARRGGAAELRRMLGEEPVKPGCGGGGRQAGGFGRIREPPMGSTAPTEIAGSARVKTGQTRKVMEPVTVPEAIRAKPVPKEPQW